MDFYIVTIGSLLYSALWIFVFFFTLNSTTSFLPWNVAQKRKMIWIDIVGNTIVQIGFLLIIVIKNNFQYLPHILFPMCWYWACEIRDLIRNKSIYFDYVPLTTIFTKSSDQVTVCDRKKFSTKTYTLHTYPYTINIIKNGKPGTLEFISEDKRKFHPNKHIRNNETFPVYFAHSPEGCLCINHAKDPGNIYPYDTDYIEIAKLTRENAQLRKQLALKTIHLFFANTRVLWASKYRPMLRMWHFRHFIEPKLLQKTKK